MSQPAPHIQPQSFLRGAVSDADGLAVPYTPMGTYLVQADQTLLTTVCCDHQLPVAAPVAADHAARHRSQPAHAAALLGYTDQAAQSADAVRAAAHADQTAAQCVDPVTELGQSAVAAQAVTVSAAAKMTEPQCSHPVNMHLPVVMMSPCVLHLPALLSELATALTHTACAVMQLADMVVAACTGIGMAPLSRRQHRGIGHVPSLHTEAVTALAGIACSAHAGRHELHAETAAHADGGVALLPGSLTQACTALRVISELGKSPRHAVHAVALPEGAVVASPDAALPAALPAVLADDWAHAE